MNPDQTDAISIALPSLIHRIGREGVKAAQTLALQHNCELKRVRRSRNWALCGKARAVQALIAALRGADSGADSLEQKQLEQKQLVQKHLIHKLEQGLLPHADKLESLDAKLARLIQGNPGVTLGELMQLTQCSIAQARLARFQTDLG
ncbi:ribosome recycling factor family protein [Shewanella salipaludis]|uniref:Ribosome recycling factor n=1 Tax=Shewanella salipaludis TaxID=2723052 RepID=A0A972FRS8_9GAMM|nr:ribosome recycling factor family protein [Shewanella salipaludis]NMH64960.1 ribosome recycling factor [Shewanella salipaludis]